MNDYSERELGVFDDLLKQIDEPEVLNKKQMAKSARKLFEDDNSDEVSSKENVTKKAQSQKDVKKKTKESIFRKSKHKTIKEEKIVAIPKQKVPEKSAEKECRKKVPEKVREEKCEKNTASKKVRENPVVSSYTQAHPRNLATVQKNQINSANPFCTPSDILSTSKLQTFNQLSKTSTLKLNKQLFLDKLNNGTPEDLLKTMNHNIPSFQKVIKDSCKDMELGVESKQEPMPTYVDSKENRELLKDTRENKKVVVEESKEEGLTQRLNRLSGSNYTKVAIPSQPTTDLDFSPMFFKFEEPQPKEEIIDTDQVKVKSIKVKENNTTINLLICLLFLFFSMLLILVDIGIFKYPKYLCEEIYLGTIAITMLGMLPVAMCRKHNKKLVMMILWGIVVCALNVRLLFYMGSVTNDEIANIIKSVMGFMPLTILLAGGIILPKRK